MSGASSPSPAEQAIREELEKTAALISGARRLMAEGRSVDLSNLEERVKAVTEAVRAAPEDVAAGYKEHLSALLDILDVLEADLETQHAVLEEGLRAIQHRAAHDAYGPKGKP